MLAYYYYYYYNYSLARWQARKEEEEAVAFAVIDCCNWLQASWPSSMLAYCGGIPSSFLHASFRDAASLV